MKISEEEIQKHFPLLQAELTKEIVNNAEFKQYRKGEYMLRKDAYIRGVYVVFEGLVKVIRENDNGNQFFMHYLKGGEACVMSMIFTDRQHICELTLKAAQPTTVLAIPFSCMEKWMFQYKSWYQFVWKNFRQRMEELFDTIDNIAFNNMDERLAYYLKLHAKQLHGNLIPTTQTEIARELNSSREVIGRLLKKLSDKGHVKLHRNSIELVRL